MREYARLHTAMLLRRLAFQVNHAAHSGDPDSIHDVRVAVRRLNTCLRVFGPFYPGRSAKRIRRQLAELMERAGAVRDLDITIALLRESGSRPGALLHAHLEEERRRACARLEGELRFWKDRGFSRKWRDRLEL